MVTEKTMLTELLIENFAIIDELRLDFANGFNVLTGETGAGKSIILDALALLMGARAETDDIRAGADRSLVEGTFVLAGSTLRDRINAVLEREDLHGDDPDVLILTREMKRSGRNTNRINGRTVNLNILQEISDGLIDIHGQTDHLSLLKASSHIGLLDRYGGLMPQRNDFAGRVKRYHNLRRDLNHLINNAEAIAQRVEMLTFKVEEIMAPEFKPGEDESLQEEARILGSSEALADASSTAYRALVAGDDGSASVNDRITEAAAALARLARIDPAAAQLAELADTVSVQIEEIIRDLSTYEDQIEFDPARLLEIETRLALLNQLKKKYHCDTLEGLLQQAEDATAELATIENSSERIEELQAEEAQLLIEIGQAGAALSRSRAEVAGRLSEGVEAELADLRMENARFSVALEQIDDPNGAPVGDYRVAFDESGIDRVEFLIAPNIGEPLKPVARIASGGETSRIMLALKTNLSRADETPTLVFDEIDAGIGGRIGTIVGEKLWGLSLNHQVFVVTHLPQLAGFGDTHFKVQKDVQGDRTVTHVYPLTDEDRVEEITAMLGAESLSARQSARDLLHYVDTVKRAAASA